MGDLFSGLRAGRSSVLSHGVALATTANNISNANTTGFKSDRAEFADMLGGGAGGLFGAPIETGDGTLVQKIAMVTEQGPIESTNRPLDAAIQGNGFFILNNGTDTLYTRAGNFSVDSQGRLAAANGYRVLGFTDASGTTPVELNVSNVVSSANPTTAVTYTGNLDAVSPIIPVPANPASFLELNDASAFSTAVRVIDSLGAPHEVSIHFFHTAQTGAWTAQAYVDAAETGGVAGTPVAVGTAANLTFDANGQPPEGALSSLVLNAAWSNGAAASTTAIDLSGFTQLAGDSFIASVSADGNLPGSLVGVELAKDGTVNAVLDNQERVKLGSIAIASFRNTQGLEKNGNNNFSATEASGEADVGAPLTEGRGELKSGSLENSNTDLSGQFIDMIRFQRGYQAGSQVIQTMNDLLNNTIQIA